MLTKIKCSRCRGPTQVEDYDPRNRYACVTCRSFLCDICGPKITLAFAPEFEKYSCESCAAKMSKSRTKMVVSSTPLTSAIDFMKAIRNFCWEGFAVILIVCGGAINFTLIRPVRALLPQASRRVQSSKTNQMAGRSAIAGQYGKKECPFCAETVQAAAIKCRFCGEVLDRSIAATATSTGYSERAVHRAHQTCATLIVIFLIALLGRLILLTVYLAGVPVSFTGKGPIPLSHILVSVWALVSIGGMLFAIVYLPMRWALLMRMPPGRRGMALFGGFGLIVLLLLELVSYWSFGFTYYRVRPDSDLTLPDYSVAQTQQPGVQPNQPVFPSRSQTREQKIESDPILSNFVERFPEMRDSLIRLDSLDVQRIETTTRMLTLSEQITFQDAKYIREFAERRGIDK